MHEVFTHIDQPDYRGLLVFSSLPRALAFVDEVSNLPCAIYDRIDMRLRFPTGASVRLGLIEGPYDHRRFAGLEFQYIEFMDSVPREAREYIAARCRSRNPQIPALVK